MIALGVMIVALNDKCTTRVTKIFFYAFWLYFVALLVDHFHFYVEIRVCRDWLILTNLPGMTIKIFWRTLAY